MSSTSTIDYQGERPTEGLGWRSSLCRYAVRAGVTCGIWQRRALRLEFIKFSHRSLKIVAKFLANMFDLRANCQRVRQFTVQMRNVPNQTGGRNPKGDPEKKLGQTMRFRHSEESEASGSCLCSAVIRRGISVVLRLGTGAGQRAMTSVTSVLRT